MAGLKYTYIPLTNATLVQRKFDRDVIPPGMVVLKNYITSRSDNIPTLRPDIKDDSSIELKAYRTLLADGSLSATDEYLNSAFGLYGNDNLIFLTSRFPIDNSTDVTLGQYSGIEYSTVISKIIDSGTATAAVTDGSPYLVNSDSSQINLNTKAWYGACVKFDSDTSYFPIRLVTDKSNLVLEAPVDFTDGTAAFSIVQSHCPANAGYKFHTELFLGNSIYNTPIFDAPFSTQRMSGPFAGNITENVEYIAYEGEFNLFSDAFNLTTQAQNEDQTSEYNSEELSKKFCASGNGIFMCVKPFWEKWEDVGDPPESTLTHAGPFYTITPEEPTSYLPPIEGGAGDIFSVLPLNGTHEAYYNRSFNRAEIVFDGTNKFYMPVVAYTADLGGGGPDYSLAIIEFADDATPTTVGHLTDYSIGAALPADGYSIMNVCYNATDSTIWVAAGGHDGGVETDEIIVVSVADWSTTVETMPSVVFPFGMEFSATADGILVCGVEDATNPSAGYDTGVAHFYECTSNNWTTLTNPTGDYQYFGCGIYDDGTNWVFTITGGTRLFYWGMNDTTTIVNTGSSFSADLDAGQFRVASNVFVYDVGGTPTYSTTVVLSGHDKVGIATVDPSNATVSFTRLVDGGFDVWNATYIGKFQRPIFSIYSAQEYVTSHPVGIDTHEFEHGVTVVNAYPGNYVNYYVDEFTPVSDIYRSKCFGIVNGYVVLFGLLEYDTNTDNWSYTPRRIRWTAPATVNDFSGTGSGTADVIGNGEFIDARTVNERIVIFESNGISILVPRGVVEDPFDYQQIYSGIRIASNPCVVNDIIYFLASDGLLYSTNGASVEEVGASFDLTSFDDFDEKSPAWLIYSTDLNSLMVFYPNSTTQSVYCISLANGSVTLLDINDNSNNFPLKSIATTESSSTIKTFFNYNPTVSGHANDEVCCTSYLTTGDGISGVDGISKGDESGGSWYSEIETGNIFPDGLEEGIKVALKHVIVHTYTDTSSVTYNPDIIIEVKSLEDTSWYSSSDPLMSSALTIVDDDASLSSSAPPSAFSYYLGVGNETPVTYNLPWVAANCRVYTYNGVDYTACALVTTTPDAINEYQISGTKQIKVYGTNGDSVYCFCDNEPFIKVNAGDYVETTSGLLRISSITDYLTSVLIANTFDGLTGSHVYAEQIPIGKGAVKMAVNKLVEGVKVRIRIVPRNSGGGDMPSIVKVTGISLGYIPLGEKIVEATGG